VRGFRHGGSVRHGVAHQQGRSNVTFPSHVMHNAKLNYKQNFAPDPVFSLDAALPSGRTQTTLKLITGPLA
jgi:hypothetical protein